MEEWVILGDLEGEQRLLSTTLSLSDYNGVPCIAYRDSNNNNRVKVQQYDLTTNTWNSLGYVSSDQAGSTLSLYITDDGTPYVAYCSVISDIGAKLMKYQSGEGWQQVGPKVSSVQTYFNSIILYDNTPYLAYQNSLTGFPEVMKYDGSSWSSVAGGLTRMTNQLSFDIHNGTPYLAYKNDINSNVVVFKIAETEPEPIESPIIYVKHDATGNNDGTSWEDAYPYLQAGLNDAEISGKDIWVARGSYNPTFDHGLDMGNEGMHFRMINGVSIYGGFAGDENPATFDLANRDFITNETILSGDLGDGSHCFHVFYHPNSINNLDYTALLDGFTITGGRAEGLYSHSNGGGMSNVMGNNPKLANIIFTENRAIGNGGGMYNFASSPLMDNVIFSRNLAISGGGIYSENEINNGPGPQLLNVTFSENVADLQGGGMYNHQSNSTLTNVTFRYNIADGAGGGLVNNSDSTIILKDVSFLNNQATWIGGGMANYASEASLTNVIFTGNSAAEGGGMYNYFGNTQVVNGLFTNNSAPGINGEGGSGGGIWNYYCALTLINSTFSKNSAAFLGGGLKINGEDNLLPVILNSILWGNTAGSAGSQISGKSLSIHYSLIEGCGGEEEFDYNLTDDYSNNLDSYPLFVDADNSNLRLQENSPAINSGTTAAVPVSVTTDLDGNPRIRGIGVDMGAYEHQEGEGPQPRYNLTLTASPSAGGTVRDITNSGPYLAGSTVNISATANSGYQFTNWSYNGAVLSTVPTFNYTMSAQNITLTANFASTNTPPPPPPVVGPSPTPAPPARIPVGEIIVDGRVVETIYKDDVKDDNGVYSFNTSISANSTKLWLRGSFFDELVKKHPNGTISFTRDMATYDLPLKCIDLVTSAKDLNSKMDNIKVSLIIEKIDDDSIVPSIKEAANNIGGRLLGDVVEFKVSLDGENGKSKEINNYNCYVTRSISNNLNVDPYFTTVMKYNPDTNSLTFAPSFFHRIGSKTTSVIKYRGNGIFVIVKHPQSFADIQSHWAKGNIEKLAGRLIICGEEGDNFKPQDIVTRSEFAVMITRALGIVEEIGTEGFNDLTDQWYVENIKTAARVGIVKGKGDGNFYPHENILREDMAAMIYRGISLTEANVDISDVDTILFRFNDENNISSYARESVAACVESGIIVGRDTGNFDPHAYSTRAEASAIIERMLRYLKFKN